MGTRSARPRARSAAAVRRRNRPATDDLVVLGAHRVSGQYARTAARCSPHRRSRPRTSWIRSLAIGAMRAARPLESRPPDRNSPRGTSLIRWLRTVALQAPRQLPARSSKPAERLVRLDGAAASTAGAAARRRATTRACGRAAACGCPRKNVSSPARKRVARNSGSAAALSAADPGVAARIALISDANSSSWSVTL